MFQYFSSIDDKNVNCSKRLESKRERQSVNIFPAEENNLSDGTDEARIHEYFSPKFERHL